MPARCEAPGRQTTRATAALQISITSSADTLPTRTCLHETALNQPRSSFYTLRAAAAGVAAAERLDDRVGGALGDRGAGAQRLQRHGPQSTRARVPDLRHAAGGGHAKWSPEPDCALFRLRPPRGRPERVRGNDPVPGAPGQRAAEPGGRPAGSEAGPCAVREWRAAGGDGGEIAVAAGRVADTSGAPTASLPRSGAGVARDGRAGAIPHQPAVRGALRGRGGLRHAGRARERLRGMEVGAALCGSRGAAALWGGTEGAGAVDRGAAGAGHAAGHPARLRGLRAAGRQAGEEAAALSAVPRGAGGVGASLAGSSSRGAGWCGTRRARASR